MKGEGRQCHVPAKAAAYNSDPSRIHKIECSQITFGFDTIPKRLSPLFPICCVHELGPISRTAAVVNCQDCVAVIHKELHRCCITLSDLSDRATVHPNQTRNFMLRTGN